MGFEPTTSAGERPQTYALDRAATETGIPAYKNEDSIQPNVSVFLDVTPYDLIHITEVSRGTFLPSGPLRACNGTALPLPLPLQVYDL